MAKFFIVALTVMLAMQLYVSWHVYRLLPFSAPIKIAVVLLMLLALCCMVFQFKSDALPLGLATALYEIGNSWLIIMFYLLMAFLVLDIGRLIHLVPPMALKSNAVTSMILAGVMLVTFVGGNIHYHNKQRKLIDKISKDFPEVKSMLEYEDYTAKPTVGNASELISRALEDAADSILDEKTYADYIATRPRAQRFGAHGLFTDDGTPVNLRKVSHELNRHEGNVWTAIISLRREDAERLEYDSGERWRDMLRAHADEFAAQFHIPRQKLRWFAAFHNESYHPHVHMIVYSTDKSLGYLTKKGVENLRSSLGREIFANDLVTKYKEQTAHRDSLRSESKELVAQIIAQINEGNFDNPVLESKLLELSKILSETNGRKVYGYLDADTKALVDEIVDELADDERLSQLYELWYQDKDFIHSTYTDEPADAQHFRGQIYR